MPLKTTDPFLKKKLGDYRIVKKIGQGGMSIVYQAVNPETNEVVAIKLLHSHLSNNPECRVRLAREASVVAKINHPNIVKIYDYSEDADELYIVSEYVPGITLKEFSQKYHLDQHPELVVKIVSIIASALEEAHRHHIIHRDIKPENILVKNDGSIKLMDFGIAHIRDQDSLTVTGTLLGSPAHMAPEIIEGKPSDERTDIFSLATLLYCLLTNELPFSGNSPHALLKSIVECDFKDPEQFNPKINKNYTQVLQKGMAKSPDARFRSALEFKGALLQLIHLLPCLNAEKIRLALAQPEKQLPILEDKITRTYLSLAKNSMQACRPTDSCSYINRILAENPDNEEAQELLASNFDLSTETHKTKNKNKILILKPAFITLILAASQIFIYQILSAHTNLLLATIPKKNWLENQICALQICPNLEILDKQSGKKEVEIFINPYANISLNGKPIATHKKYEKLKLAPGEYQLDFSHDYAQTVTKNLFIKNNNSTLKPLYIFLERSKPSELEISSPVDADIIINKKFRGTVFESKKNPIKIRIPDKRHDREIEIIVTKKGFVPLITKKRVVAGTKHHIDINLLAEETS